MSIKIMLADDHQIMRDGLRSLIEKLSGMEIVAEAENGRSNRKRNYEQLHFIPVTGAINV